MYMIYILIALLAGSLIVVSRVINSNLAEKIGLFKGTLVNYVVGLSASAVFFAVEYYIAKPEGFDFAILPWWAWLGGVTGVMVVVLSNYITPKISSFAQTLLVFIGQLFTGVVIDLIGMGSVSPGKIVGGLMVLSGLIFNTFVDRES